MTKPHILILTGLLWLAACSPSPGSGRAQFALVFQPGKDLPSLHRPPIGSQSSNEIGAVEPAAATSVALLEEVHDLAAQRQADLVSAGPGWLHLITRHTHSKVTFFSAFNYSSGQYQQEEWLSLDDQGLVRAEIKRVANDPGQTGDLSLLQGEAWTNLGLTAQNSSSSTLPYDPNDGIYELFASLLRQGQTLNKATLYKECWYQGEKYTISDGRIIHEVLFKPDDHALRWIKIWDVSSGEITLVDSIEIALEERLPSPPDDVLNLISQTTP